MAAGGDQRLLLKHASKRVLDEDEYLDALGRIIERDYFPHSQQLHAHLQMLHEADRLGADVGNAHGNSQRIEALLQRVKTEQRSLQQHMPRALAEPSARVGGDPYAHHTVDSFLASHTSEDNASFEALQLRDQAERRRKMHWLYEPGEDVEYTRRAALMDPTAMLMLTNGTQAGAAAASSSSTAGQKPGMLMLYYKGGTQLSASQRADLDRRLDAIVLREGGNGRSARPEGSKFRVRNHLMFPPDTDSTHNPGSNGAYGSSSSFSNGSGDGSKSSNVGLRAPKILQRGNTAMPGSTTELIRSLVPSGGGASAAERPHSPSVYSEFSGYTGYTEGLEVGPDGATNAAARKYRPVPMSPHREAGKDGDEPPMTWGVVGLPLLLDEGSRFGFVAPLGTVASSSSRLPAADLFADEGAGDGSLHFSMSLSKREALAHGLDRTARRRESKEGGADKKGKRQKDRDKERRGEGRSAAAVALAARIAGASASGLSIAAPTPFCEASLLRASYGQTPRGGTSKRGVTGEHARARGATPAPLASSSSSSSSRASTNVASKLTADDMRGLLRL